MHIFFILTNNKNGDFMNMDFSEVGVVIYRGLISLVALFLVTKMLGKKQVSQLSLFDYVIGISIGNFAAEMTVNLDTNEINGIVAVLVFGFVAYIVSIATMKSIVLRKFFMGKPTLLIQDGKLLMEGLKKVKFDINDLLEECRGKGYFDISQIAYAVMEINGQLSILPKSEYAPPTLKDLNIKKPKATMCANIIIDGCIMSEALTDMQKNEKWLRHELKTKGVRLEDVLLATLDEEEKLMVYEKNVNVRKYNILE